MTESEWDACTEPQKMLAFLRDSGRASKRKARLFGCACLRQFGRWLEGRPSGAAVQVAERLADGMAADAEVEAAQQGARHDTWDVLGVAALLVIRDARDLLDGRFSNAVTAGVVGWQGRKAAARDTARRIQTEFLRDIF